MDTTNYMSNTIQKRAISFRLIFFVNIQKGIAEMFALTRSLTL